MINKGDIVQTTCELCMNSGKYEVGVNGVVIAIIDDLYVVHAVGDFLGHNAERLTGKIYRSNCLELGEIIERVYENDKKCFILRESGLKKIDKYEIVNSIGGI